MSALIFRASPLSGNPWMRLAVPGTGCQLNAIPRIRFQYVQPCGLGRKRVLRMRIEETPPFDGVPLPTVVTQWLNCSFSKLRFFTPGGLTADELQGLPAVIHWSLTGQGGGQEIVPEGALSRLPADADSSSSRCVGRVCTYLRIFW